MNGYMPVGQKSRKKIVNFFDGYIDGYTITVFNREQTARGFDAELGWNSYFYSDSIRAYMGIGPAWFKNDHSKDDQWAFKARGLLQWSRYLSIEARTFKEQRSNWHWQGAVFLLIPFECFRDLCACDLNDLFSRPVYRNAMIKSCGRCGWETNY